MSQWMGRIMQPMIEKFADKNTTIRCYINKEMGRFGGYKRS